MFTCDEGSQAKHVWTRKFKRARKRSRRSFDADDTIHPAPHSVRMPSLGLTPGMCNGIDILVDLLKEFCSEGLLYWVEVCSVLGDLRSALLSLDNVRRALAVCHFGCHDICPLRRSIDKYRQKTETMTLLLTASGLCGNSSLS